MFNRHCERKRSNPVRIAASLALLAMTAPAHATTRDDLEHTRQELADSKKRSEQLEQDNKKLEGELASIQRQLVESAAAIQKGEAELSSLEEKIRILAEQVKIKNEALAVRKNNLAALIQAALRLSRTPPEAVVLMPGDSAQTMKAARALSMATAGIKEEAAGIKLQVEELTHLQQKVTTRRAELMEKQELLAKDRQALKTTLTERRKLQENLGREQQEEAQKLSRLAKKADDLQDLMDTLRAGEKIPYRGREIVLDMPSGKASGTKGKLRSFARAQGKIRPPLAGRVVQSFGSLQGKNTTSKGAVISAREGAQVTAPYDGEVVFTGPFMGYGKMIIIRHSDDFHTLLAGLAKIDTRPGEFLLEGEPIGAMGDRESANRLYLELRKDNQPVDPAPWIAGMNKK
jgi:septal ring factor EnvC (AmiA/AmiB activator)